MRFSAQEKFTILQELKSGRYSGKELCRIWGVSRVSLSIWKKRFEQSGELSARYSRSFHHYRSLHHKTEEKIIQFIGDNPRDSLPKILKQLRKQRIRIGSHGLQNLMVRKKLNHVKSRIFYAEKYHLPSFHAGSRGRFSSDIRHRYINSILSNERPVALVARQTGISRTTLYNWIEKYKKGNSGYILAPQYISGERHYKFLSRDLTDKVLDTVIANPNYSALLIYETCKLRGINIGYHAVQNVLTRYNLRYAKDRYLYARKFGPATTIAPVSSIDTVSIPSLDQLSPTVLPGPPPPAAPVASVSLQAPQFHPPRTSVFFRFKHQIGIAFLTSGITSGLIFGLSQIILTLSSARSPVELIGLLFATLALTCGTFFFIYSIKYYINIALVLIFSRNQAGKSSQLTVDSSQEAETATNYELRTTNSNSSFIIRPSTTLRAGNSQPTTKSGLIPDLSNIVLARHPLSLSTCPSTTRRG